MSAPLLLGIDIGTQGTKAALFQSDGQLIAESFEPSRLISSQPGIVTQSPDEIYLSVIHTIQNTLDKSSRDPGDIAGIGLSGQMAGILGIHEDGTAATPYDSWLDTRCEPYIGIMKSHAENEIIQTTGSPVTYAHGPKILWWKNEYPQIYNRIARFVEPTTYVALRLCGKKAQDAYIDYTQVHFSGFGNVQTRQWSQELLDCFFVSRNKMPDIVEPWKTVGGVTCEVASATGLMMGTPVIAGCGDQAATSLGAGIIKPGQMLDVSGTACLLSFCTSVFAPDLKSKTFLYARSIIPDLWIPLAYSGGSGLCLKWFAENLAQDVQGGLPELDKMAMQVAPGSDRLIFVPHFGGRTCPNNPNVRGSYIGLTWAHRQRHLYRAIMESIGYEYHYYLQSMRDLLGELPEGDVRVIGGGSKSMVFNQIKSDILGKEYWTLNRRDGATLGSALLAGYGAGVFNDLSSEVTKMIQLGNHIQPDLGKHEQYQPMTAAYEEIINQLVPVYQHLI